MRLIRFSDWHFRLNRQIVIVKDVHVVAAVPEDVSKDPFYIRRAIRYHTGKTPDRATMEKYEVIKVVLTERTFGEPATPIE